MRRQRKVPMKYLMEARLTPSEPAFQRLVASIERYIDRLSLKEREEAAVPLLKQAV